MLHTITIGSCVSVQGEFVTALDNGQVVIRDGARTYRGRPIAEARLAKSGTTPAAR